MLIPTSTGLSRARCTTTKYIELESHLKKLLLERMEKGLDRSIKWLKDEVDYIIKKNPKRFNIGNDFCV
jgi:hypothetical protein